MTRQHFIAFADMLRDSLHASTTADERARVATIACESARIFAAANPRFNFSTFYAACGLAPSGGPGIVDP